MVKLSVLVCCSKIDLSYLFERSIKSILEFIPNFETLYIVTSEKEKVQSLLSYTNANIVILKDEEVLTNSECKLCGWSRQQIIKLKSFDFIQADFVLAIGADTILMKKVDLVNFLPKEEYETILYRKHYNNNIHYRFERERCKNINNLLKVDKSNPMSSQDYIFDFFIFRKSILISLRSYLESIYGKNYFQKIFPFKVRDYEDMVKVGEWTLYNLYIMNVLKKQFRFYDGTNFLKQIHTIDELKEYDSLHSAIHFVRKDFDIKIINFIIKNNFNE